MKGLFEVAAGSIKGRNHNLVGKNNQDSYYTFSSELATIAVVCDGCGSSTHSEVGAKIGARLIVKAIAQKLNGLATAPSTIFLEIKQDVLTQLKTVAETIAQIQTFSQIIQEYFLFTVVGALVTPKESLVFSIGDGVIALNGKMTQIGPFPHNAPPYLAYGLLDNRELGNFQIHHQLPTSEVESILIATDGISDLIESQTSYLPGKQETVGAIAQFWQEDRYFHNPDMIRRRLSLLNRSVTKPDWGDRRLVKQVGLLPDDTTLVAIRKTPNS